MGSGDLRALQLVERLAVDELEQLERLAVHRHLRHGRVALLPLAAAGDAHAAPLADLGVGYVHKLFRSQVEELHAEEGSRGPVRSAIRCAKNLHRPLPIPSGYDAVANGVRWMEG